MREQQITLLQDNNGLVCVVMLLHTGRPYKATPA